MEEIKETEIRIIGQTQPYKPKLDMSSDESSCSSTRIRDFQCMTSSDDGLRFSWKWILFILLFLIGLSSLLFMPRAASDEKNDIRKEAEQVESIQKTHQIQLLESSANTNKNISGLTTKKIKADYCQINRIIVNDVPLKIFNSGNAVPELRVGKIENTDSHVIMAFRAADIREDNGGIVGACINNGQIISKGLSKVGFVAIINGNIKIGAELNSPYFEEAIQSNGSFFRQYALVKDGLLIENNIKGKSIRRAICELDGKTIVIESESRESFHDFSQALIEYGATNAVCLVGGASTYGFCRQGSGSFEEWGDQEADIQKNATYIVWVN